MVEKESHMTARLLAWVAKEMCVLHQDRKMEKLVCEGGWRRLPKGYTGQQCYCSTYCRQNGFLPLLGKYPFPYLMRHRVQGDGQLSRRLIRGGHCSSTPPTWSLSDQIILMRSHTPSHLTLYLLFEKVHPTEMCPTGESARIPAFL